MKRVALLLALLVLVLWVYFNNRQGKAEFYTTEDVDKLVDYIERDGRIDAEYIKNRLKDLSKDNEFILIAYNLAKTDKRDELSDLIYQVLLNEKSVK